VPNSISGFVIGALPLRTTPASASASTAPVGSFSADSAMIVCETFGLRRSRSSSGIRIAGSVGASAAPISSPIESETSDAAHATTPVTNAVSTTPGIASRVIPIATRSRTSTDSFRPP
jgi:hypothetical protein